MIELMKQLCALPGPSGCEDAVREFVLEKVKPFADEIKDRCHRQRDGVPQGQKGARASDRCCAHTWTRSALSSSRLRTTAC